MSRFAKFSALALLLVFTLCARYSQIQAQSDPARAVVESYLAAQHKSEWKTSAGLIDPQDLSNFKAQFQAIFSKSPDMIDTTVLRPSYFGVKSISELGSVDSVTYAAGVFNLIFTQMPTLKTMLTTAQDNILGSVNEGADLKHFVMRVNVAMPQEKLSNIEVVTVKKVGSQWRISAKRNLEQMTSLFRRMISAG